MSHATPAWAVVPFALYLLLIATLPLFASRFWERNRNKLALALLIAVPSVVYLFALTGAILALAFGLQGPRVRRLYADAELRRMRAFDHG